MNENEKLQLNLEDLKDVTGGTSADFASAVIFYLTKKLAVESAAQARLDAIALAELYYKNGVLAKADYEAVLKAIDQKTL